MKRQFQFVSILLFILIMSVACSNNENKELDSEAQPISEENVNLTISAAASLKDAMDVIQETYQEEHPEVSLTFNFGSSGSLQQQISQGAPVDIFFSAAEDKFDLLVEEDNISEDDGIDLLGNELVLIVPKGESNIKNFKDLTKNEVFSISIGTPEIVPAGKYAKEALENMNVWKDVESKIVPAKDVRQVVSYVETGNVDAGIVYRTDAQVSEKVDIIADADSTTHTPIVYPIGIIKESNHYEAAKEFYKYLQSDDALKVFDNYGFITR